MTQTISDADVSRSFGPVITPPRLPSTGESTIPRLDTAANQFFVKKTYFTPQQTAQLMLIFDQCKTDGLFDSEKRRDWKKVWEVASKEMEKTVGDRTFSTKIIQHKYDNERRRFRYWKALEEYPGTTFDEEKQVLVCDSPERWEAFKRTYEGSQSLGWLKRTPLGNIPVYRSVFSRDAAVPCGIQSPSDVEVALARRADSSDNSEEERNRWRDGRRGRKRKRANIDAFVLAVEKLAEAVARYKAPREPGSADIARAIGDFEDHYYHEYSVKEAMTCFEKLCEPRNAVIWNTLKSVELKKCFVSEWLGK